MQAADAVNLRRAVGGDGIGLLRDFVQGQLVPAGPVVRALGAGERTERATERAVVRVVDVAVDDVEDLLAELLPRGVARQGAQTQEVGRGEQHEAILAGQPLATKDFGADRFQFLRDDGDIKRDTVIHPRHYIAFTRGCNLANCSRRSAAI